MSLDERTLNDFCEFYVFLKEACHYATIMLKQILPPLDVKTSAHMDKVTSGNEEPCPIVISQISVH